MSRWRAVAGAVMLGLLAALMATGSARAAARPWATCTDRTAAFSGPWRDYDDIFAGRSGHFCIRAVRNGIHIQDIVRAQPGGVVAYPSRQYGPWYAWRDTQSGLPAELGPHAEDLGTMDVYVASTGRASGQCLSDLDVWLGPNGHTQVHPDDEIVIVNRSCTGLGGGRLVRIGGRSWRALRWYTCPLAPPASCWPLMRFAAVRQSDRARIVLTGFLATAERWRWLPATEQLWSFDYGTEIWQGIFDLDDTDTLRWVKLPVISEQP